MTRGGIGRPPEWFAENPHARSSYSRLATHRRCPGWYRYQYLDWHRSWSPAVTRAGQAVQDAFEKTVDAEPAADVTWEQLEERAGTRAQAWFDRFWQREEEEHASDPNSHGPWDLPRHVYEGYLRRGLRWHLEEARARSRAVHPRTGAALPLPPIDRVGEAWAAVRPLHAPTGTSTVASLESIPKGYFQGQCDLVYTWTGGRRLVDLKASGGKSAFSTEIRVQLLAYAYLDRALGRGRAEGLEAWFLGLPEPTVFEVPPDDEMREFDAEVRDLIVRSGHLESYGSFDAEAFPPEPAEVPGHAPGRGEPSGWCRFCPAALLCPRTPREAPPVGGGTSFDALPEDAPSGGITVEGIVLGVASPIDKGDGRIKRRFTLANASGARSFSWDADAVLRLAEQGLRAGRTVRIDALNPWRPPSGDDVLLFPSPRTALAVLAE